MSELDSYRDLLDLKWRAPGDLTLLSRDHDPYTSAQAYADCGVIVVEEAFLCRAPKEVVAAVLIHEMVHQRLSGVARAAATAEVPEVDRFFHRELVPAWLSSEVNFVLDADYVTGTKGWANLYGSRTSPGCIEHTAAVNTVRQYFWLLAHGGVIVSGDTVSAHPMLVNNPRVRGPVVSFTDKNLRDEFACACLTGYAVSQYLMECCRDFALEQTGTPNWLLEEGVANFIATSVTGVSLRKIGRFAPQDSNKVWLAEQLIAHGAEVEAAIAALDSYASLRLFYSQNRIA